MLLSFASTRFLIGVIGCTGVLAFAACSSSPSEPAPAAPAPTSSSSSGSTGALPVPDSGSTEISTGDPFDVPIDGVNHDEVTAFNEGDELFDLQLRDGDGLGPLYTQTSCGGCHENAERGPGLVQKMSVVEADGITPSPDQSKLPFGATVHPLVTAGAKTPITPPPNDPTIKVTIRIGPPVFGRGYIEAILDSEIERVASEQAARTDGIHGRANHVIYASEPNSVTTFNQHKKGDSLIGRFGLKARIGTIDEFVADAFQGDMGITSPMRPTEILNPDGLTDDLKPGVDVTIDSVNKRATYLRYIAIPHRRPATEAATISGRALFDQAKCSVCHVPSLKTQPNYPIALLANIDAPVFTDVLLHDLGDALADGTPTGLDGEATSRTWRTAPLIGLRFLRTFLHDGRAKSIHDAIEGHNSPGSEAIDSVQTFNAMSPADQQTLLDFVNAL